MSKPKQGGKRPGAGRKPGPPSKTISFKIPVFTNPVHETELKQDCREVINEFVVGKERVL